MSTRLKKLNGAQKQYYVRHSVWGICLDVDFKCDFVVINKAPLWISHVLKHKMRPQWISPLLLHCNEQMTTVNTFIFKPEIFGSFVHLHSKTWSWRSPNRSLCGRTGGWSCGWTTSRRLYSWWFSAWLEHGKTMTWNKITFKNQSLLNTEKRYMLKTFYIFHWRGQNADVLYIKYRDMRQFWRTSLKS